MTILEGMGFGPGRNRCAPRQRNIKSWLVGLPDMFVLEPTSSVSAFINQRVFAGGSFDSTGGVVSFR